MSSWCSFFLLPAQMIAGIALLCWLGAPPIAAGAESGMQSSCRVFVVSHGWHSGIVVSREAASRLPRGVLASLPRGRYLEFGWGDERFYQAQEPGVWLGLRAALLPTQSVLQVVAFPDEVEHYFSSSELVEIELNSSSCGRLLKFVARSFFLDAKGYPQQLGPSLYGRGAFFRSEDSFHMFKNCNTWTSEALKQGGCFVEGPPCVSASAVMKQARSCRKLSGASDDS